MFKSGSRHNHSLASVDQRPVAADWFGPLSRQAPGGYDVVILIFGAGGQIGQQLVAAMQTVGMPAMALTRDQADISDERQVAAAIASARPGVVVNAAGFTNVDRAEVEPDAAMRANATGPAVVAEQCAAAGLPLIHFSTDYVFDGEKAGAYREDDPVAAVNVYGSSKLAGEQAIRARLDDHLILRVAWVYGRYGTNFLKTMLRLARERNTLRVVADRYGCPTASEDIADAVIRVVPLVLEGRVPFGTYHFAGSGETTRYGFATEIIETANAITGRSTTVVPVSTSEYPTNARRPAHSVLDCALFEQTFGFRAGPWQEATRKAVREICGSGGAR